MTRNRNWRQELATNLQVLASTLLGVLETAFAVAAWAVIILFPIGFIRNRVGGAALHFNGFVARIRYTSQQIRTAVTIMLISIPVFETLLIIAKLFGHMLHALTSAGSNHLASWIPVINPGTPVAVLGMLIILGLIVAFIFRGGDLATAALAGGFFGRKRRIVLRVSDQQPHVPPVRVRANMNQPLGDVENVEVPVQMKWEHVRAAERGPLAFLMIYIMVLGCITGLAYILPIEYNIGLAALSNIGWLVWILGAMVMEVLDLNWYRMIGKPAFYLMMLTPMVWMFASMIFGLDNPSSAANRIKRARMYDITHSEQMIQASTVGKITVHDTIVTVRSANPTPISLNADNGKITSFKIVAVEGTVCWNHQDQPDCSGPEGESWMPGATGTVVSGRTSLSEFFAADQKMGSALCSLNRTAWSSCTGFTHEGEGSIWIVNANQVRSQTDDDTGFRTYTIEYTIERRYDVTPDGKLALAK